ncbi:MAG: hypothetical protein LBV54_04515 [Puniceicoccales bacterium]|jgi:hypothetical protein|nr:hypothetical protein [Puniceicoccales bacterium]
MFYLFARLSRILRRPVFAFAPVFAFVAALICGCSTTPEPPRSAASLVPSVKSYTRFVRTGEDDFSMQMAVRTFVPTRRAGPSITLISAVHIGSESYYAQLQKILDGKRLLLFEGVSEDPDAFKRIAETGEHNEGLYDYIAKASGLTVQASSIKYNRRHFKNADLSLKAMRRILDREIEGGGPKAAAAKEAAQLMGEVEGLLVGEGGFSMLAVRGLLGLMQDNAPLRTLFLLHLGTVEDSQAVLSSLGTPGVRRLERLILHDRNAAAMSILRQAMKGEEAPASIGIFYGAAHMPGMETILRLETDYVLSRTVWLNAFTVHPKAAGLTDEMIAEFIQRAVPQP